jgi:hypothetical protein
MAPRRNRAAVEQTTPTFQTLLNRYNSGLTSKKEITRRVEVGPPNKETAENHIAYDALKVIALKEGWIRA